MKTLIDKLGAALKEAGVCAFGVSEVAPVEDKVWQVFERWLKAGFHAGMEYMEKYRDIRRNPALLLEGARSIISVAFNYRQPNPFPKIATYALGEDYHKAIRRRLKKVVRDLYEEFGGGWRVCIDSAPILERYWAEKSGVGRKSPVHGNIVVPGIGSMVFLAEILTTHTLPPTPPLESSVDDLEENMMVCPGGALQKGSLIDCTRCVNYLTIEHKGDWTDRQRKIMDLPANRDIVFGCDKCQLSSPYNMTENPPILPEFEILPEIERLAVFASDRDLEASQMPEIAKSPVKRAGKEGLRRNLRLKSNI